MTVLSTANVRELTKENRNRTIAAISACFPLATLAVVLRFTARKISRTKIWYDDWLACSGLVAVGVFASLILVSLPDDNILRGEPIPEKTLLANAKMVYIVELFYLIAQFILKSSILAFYWRLFNVSSMRVPIYLTTCFVVAWFIPSILVSAFQCVPVTSLWTPALQASAKCVDTVRFVLGISIPNILSDLFLLLLPMPYVWSLKISRTQKIFVTGFFLLGGFVLIASAMRLRQLFLLDPQELLANWTVEQSVLWSAMENCIGVVCACLPSLRPIFRLLPGTSALAKSLGSTRARGHTVTVSGLEPDPSKGKQPQPDEYELLERDFASCWVETGRSVGGNSIKTTDEENITVQTKIHVSIGGEQPAETV